MNWEQLRYQNVERDRLHFAGDLENWSLEDWSLCVAGEVGEAINAYKKAYLRKDEYKIGAFLSELADVVLYYDLHQAKQKRSVNYAGPLPAACRIEDMKGNLLLLHKIADVLLDGQRCSLNLIPCCYALGLTDTHIWNKFNEVSTRVGYPQVIP